MFTLVEAIIPNGDVTYVGAVPETETTTEVQGNVTINNMGSPGSPAYFDVSFRLSAKFEKDGIETSVYLTPSVVVTGKSKDASFREIEMEAALDVAPMLRAMADRIDGFVNEYASTHQVGEGTGSD